MAPPKPAAPWGLHCGTSGCLDAPGLGRWRLQFGIFWLGGFGGVENLMKKIWVIIFWQALQCFWDFWGFFVEVSTPMFRTTGDFWHPCFCWEVGICSFSLNKGYQPRVLSSLIWLIVFCNFQSFGQTTIFWTSSFFAGVFTHQSLEKKINQPGWEIFLIRVPRKQDDELLVEANRPKIYEGKIVIIPW